MAGAEEAEVLARVVVVPEQVEEVRERAAAALVWVRASESVRVMELVWVREPELVPEQVEEVREQAQGLEGVVEMTEAEVVAAAIHYYCLGSAMRE